MSEYIIEMKNITKRFPGIVANDNVTIQVKKGEIYALLGENGAGKSTLMSMLFGMYEPDEGEIYIRGDKVNISSPNHATKLNIGMVHQHFKLVSNYTIAENIIMGMEPVKKIMGMIPVVDIKKANEEIRELSEKYGLEVNPTDDIKPGDVAEFDLGNDEEISTENLDPEKLYILNEDGTIQHQIDPGVRIFSRKSTAVMIKKAKKAFESKSDIDYKDLGRYIFGELDRQTNRPEEYVEQ